MLLADIAEALAGQIPRHPRQRLGDEARAALGLMQDHIPATLRPTARMAEVADVLTTAENQVNRDNRLYAAVAGIDDAVRRGDLPAAYFSYDSLLKDYADLAGNERLERAMDEVSRAQQAEVKTVPRMQAAEGEVAALGVSAEVALASRDAAPAGEAAECRGHVVVALAGGAAYGVDAATGKVRWRRLLGGSPARPRRPFRPSPSRRPPAATCCWSMPMAGNSGGWRGKPAASFGGFRWASRPAARPWSPAKWRQWPCPAAGWCWSIWQRAFRRFPCNCPSRCTSRLPTTRTLAALPGRGPLAPLRHFAAGGPLPAGGSPRASPRRRGRAARAGRRFPRHRPEPGEKEFILRALRLRASHAKTPRFAQAAVLSDGKSPRFARPVLLSGAKEPEAILQPAQQVRLRGQVTSPMACEGARVLVAAAEGMLYVFDLGGSDPAAPLQKIAEQPVDRRGNAATLCRAARRSFLGGRHEIGALSDPPGGGTAGWA